MSTTHKDTFKLIKTPFKLVDLGSILLDSYLNGVSKNNQKIKYYNIVCAFDIETTSFIDKDIPIDKPNKRSIMYVWQLAINGRCIIGRTWKEFLDCIDHIISVLELDNETRLIIYVHNLAFEFQFIRKMFQWHKVFSTSKRKPIYAITTTGIEFRCSYILTNYSLEKLGQQLHKYHVSKMVGDLDYSLVRTPLTPLSDKELQYCIYDVLVVSAYIKEQIEIEGNITRIPLTCTGYCRRFVRHNCLYAGGKNGWRKQFYKYHNMILNLQINDVEELNQMQRAFMGGFTHCSYYYSGYTQYNVDSIDFTSSYPYVLLSEQFPMSTGKLVTITSNEELEKYLKNYCCIFDCVFHDLKTKYDYENYIPISKCYKKSNIVKNNGRVYSADIVGITLTNLDFDIIRKTYSFSKADIYNFRIYKKGYLPKEIILSIIDLYKKKTTLKNVKGKEQEYLVSKGLLNSIFGMMVTAITRPEIIYNDDNEWIEEQADPEKEITKYNKSRRRFLFYAWGIFCTAYARYNLWAGIMQFKGDYIYSDTDSIKCLNIDKHMDYINFYNSICKKKLKKMCSFYDIDYDSELLPKTIKGETKPLGVWDIETKDHKYQMFKTLGAKRYMIYDGEELSITVSGVNKKTAIPHLLKHLTPEQCFDAFNDGLIIPEEATGKLTHYYIDGEYKGRVTDYQGIEYKYHALSGIYLEKTSYSFDIANDYIEFLKGVYYTK